MNILLITSDQQHHNTIGRYNPEISTPNLDRLAEEGAYFDRAYCPNPTCTPTRASLITGQYPSQHGAWTLGTKLPESVPTVGDLLTGHGYETALVGKAHFQPVDSTEQYPSLEAYPVLQDLDFWRDFHGPFYGFSHVELARNHTDEPLVGQHYALWMEEKGLTDWRRYFREPTGTRQRTACSAWDIPEEYHYNAWIAERTNALLEQYSREEKPFFLWASFFDPHPDYVVPEPWYSMYDNREVTMPDPREDDPAALPPHFALARTPGSDFSAWRESGYFLHGMHSHDQDPETLKKYRRTYYGMISMMDKYIGKILDRVEALGLEDDALIVFTTDHGHFIGEHGLCAKGPFLYEDMIKIPLIVKGKGMRRGKCGALQSLVDFSPTILEALGLPVPRTMSGRSQYSVWRGDQESARDHIICEHHHEPTTVNLRTYVDERYKITVYMGRDYGEIFDLASDPGEHKNLWGDRDLRLALLQKYISAELVKEIMWMPRISNA